MSTEKVTNLLATVTFCLVAAHLGRGEKMETAETLETAETTGPLDAHLNIAWWALKIGLGVGPIITGTDKYFDKLADWGMYLSPLATKVVPIEAATFMHVAGAVEIIAGLIVLSRWTKIGSYIVMLWLLAIAANLLTTGMFAGIAMRDIEIAIGAFALSQLSTVRGRHSKAPNSTLAAPTLQPASTR